MTIRSTKLVRPFKRAILSISETFMMLRTIKTAKNAQVIFWGWTRSGARTYGSEANSEDFSPKTVIAMFLCGRRENEGLVGIQNVSWVKI